MKKYITLCFLFTNITLYTISSSINFRTTTSAPLFFSLIDYQAQDAGLEIMPFFAAMYDTSHTNASIILGEKNTLIFDQQGRGDFNPAWINLIGYGTPNYYSHVTFIPQYTQGGMLFHYYKEFDKAFIDIKTSLLQCKSKISIEENTDTVGFIPNISNVYQAFTQSFWNYGKIGDETQVVGLDNIQIQTGTTVKVGGTQHTTMSIFGLIEIPTGTGSTAEWLFEPKVGTNHLGLGGGAETLIHCNDDLTIFICGNYRYFFKGWETRSFDLLNNGPWSRYLGIQPTYSLPDGNPLDPLPGINLLTQQALIHGRSEINLYGSLEKRLHHCTIKFGYNYFYTQEESIDTIKQIMSGYGIYDMNGQTGGGGGFATSSTATINQGQTQSDTFPTEITTAMLDKNSACSQRVASNRFTALIERAQDTYNYGFGTNLDVALSQSAISSWAVWAKFQYIF